MSATKVLYKLSHFFWYLFILSLPFGTRLIIKPRLVDGVFIEWGTVSIFASEIVLLLYCFIVILLVFLDWENIKERILEYKKVVIALAVFLALALISAINSQFFAVSCWQFLRLLEVSLLFLSVIILRPSFKTTALVFSLSLIPSLVLAIFQFGFQFSSASKWLGIAQHLPEVLGTSVLGFESGRFLRAYGTFAHPNIFAAYLAVNFWLLVYLILENKNKIQKIILFFLSFLNFYCLFLTFSRAAWLALGVGFIVLLFHCFIVRLKIEWKRTLILFVILLIFASILVYVHSDLVFSRLGGDSYLEVKSISERMAGYAEAREIIFKSSSSSPFEKGGLRGILFGAGPGAYTYALAQKFPELSLYALQPVHNFWLLILSELGIFGFLAVALFLIVLFRNFNGSRLRSNKNNDILRASEASREVLRFNHGFISILLGVLLVLSLFDHYLWSLWQGLVLGGLVLSLILTVDKS